VRIQDGTPAEDIVTWESALPFVPEALRKEFRGYQTKPLMQMVVELPRGGWVAEGEPKPVVVASWHLEPV
jgi:hypothetical protein